MKKNLFIGTSGWSYKHWTDIFYPRNVKPKDWLTYFANFFQTVEINSSFYHLPAKKTFLNWQKVTPDDFIFSVKASRFITHVLKLKNASEPWERFIKNAEGLGNKLGPILFQFPPNWSFNKDRLTDFLKILPHKYLYAFEFRNESWFQKETYQLLEKFGAALCIADSPRYPCVLKITAPFTFIRMHGGKILYASEYSIEELSLWSERIKKFIEQNIKVFVYFNNDAYGYAVKNAQQLIELLKENS